jgi:predicted SAM-dependent methyltransferase
MIRLHLGCGARNFGSGWVHIDGGEHPHLHSRNVAWLPFADDAVDLIYASHLLAYFDRQEAADVLLEWRRVLKPGGVLRLAVPDFEVLARLYVEGLPLPKILGPLYGRMSMGPQLIYHRTTYDFESLSQLLHASGFEHVARYDWRETEHAEFDDHSQAYLPHMDKDRGTLISLNVECHKRPGR